MYIYTCTCNIYYFSGCVLVAWGQSNVLHVWDISLRVLKQVVELPAKMKQVQSMFFVPRQLDKSPQGMEQANTILALQSQDGIIRFISIINCRQLFQLGSVDMV